MDFKAQFNGLFHESWALLSEPRKFWNKKLSDEFSFPVIPSFLIPYLLLVGLAVMLGEVLWSEELLWSYAILKAVREVVSYTLQFTAAIFILNRLLHNFKGTSNKKALNNVVIYSLLPFLISSVITGLFPGLYILGIIGLYGFYLFVVGTQACLEIPAELESRFIILSILLIILVFGTINVISWKLFQVLFPYGA